MNERQRDPTPQEIAERCAEIRAEWSEAVRQRRLRYDWRCTVEPLEPMKTTTKTMTR